MGKNFIHQPDVPLRYTPVRDPRNDPLGSVSEFWDIPKFADTLLGIKELLSRLVVW